MYTVYQGVIKKYIVEQLHVIGFEDMNDIPKLANNIRCFDIESQFVINVLRCIKYMMEVINIGTQIVWGAHGAKKIYINSNVDKLSMEVIIDCTTRDFIYCLGGYPLWVPDKNGVNQRALLLFLLDPLSFVKRSIDGTDCMNYERIKSFFLLLKEWGNNMKSAHIKYWLIMEMDLITDIKEIIIERYIGVSFNREIIRKYLEDNKN